MCCGRINLVKLRGNPHWPNLGYPKTAVRETQTEQCTCTLFPNCGGTQEKKEDEKRESDWW
jgi:hypothetical protein